MPRECVCTLKFEKDYLCKELGFPGGAGVKNLPASAGDRRVMGSIPGSGRSPGGGHGNPLQHSCWRIPWKEELGRLQSIGLQRVGHK